MMRRRRRAASPPRPRPGSILVYRGSDIGVVERIDDAGGGAVTLMARGGISGSLCYTVPASAVAVVDTDARRCVVDESVRFDQASPGAHGEVLLAGRPESRAPGSAEAGGLRVPRACAGFRVYARDGLLGVVEAGLCHAGTDVDFLIVRVTRGLRTRYPIIPASFVARCDLGEGIVLLTGARSELAARSERLPLAS